MALDRASSGFGCERAQTTAELVEALATAHERTDRLTLVEAVTDPLDVPARLVAVAQAAAAANAAAPAR